MDRQKKLIIVGAAGLFLLIAIIVLVALAFRGNKQPVEPAPAPIETIEPVATPTEAPAPTPEPTPVATPVAPVETPMPEPEEPPEPTPEAGAPTLPGSSSSTPKPTQKPTTTPSFDFSMPSAATIGAKLDVTVSAKHITAVEWRLIKKGDIEIEVNANSTSDADAAFTKDGGSISFKNTGSYTLKAIATTTEGLRHTVSRNIEISAAAATTPVPGATNNPNGNATTGGFAFGLPKMAYTDTVVTVSVPAGAGDVTWSMTKDGKEIALADAFAGKLSNDGGMIVFKAEGVYVLTGAAASGSMHSATITVSERTA